MASQFKAEFDRVCSILSVGAIDQINEQFLGDVEQYAITERKLKKISDGLDVALEKRLPIEQYIEEVAKAYFQGDLKAAGRGVLLSCMEKMVMAYFLEESALRLGAEKVKREEMRIGLNPGLSGDDLHEAAAELHSAVFDLYLEATRFLVKDSNIRKSASPKDVADLESDPLFHMLLPVAKREEQLRELLRSTAKVGSFEASEIISRLQTAVQSLIAESVAALPSYGAYRN